MNDLEERLREDLRAATDWIPDDVDPNTMLWTGRRVRRSRLVSRTAVAAALLVVGGLVAPAAWQSLQPPPRVPSPMQTVSAVPSDPPTPADPLATTFDLHDQGLGKNGPVIQSIRVQAEPAGQQVAIRVTVAYEAKTPVERRFTTDAGKAWQVAWDKHLLIGVLPGQVDWFTVQSGSDKGVYSGAAQELAGIGASAIWNYFEGSGGPESVRGVIWQAPDGAVYDSLGNSVPSATIRLSDETYLVFKDADLDYLGIRPSEGGSAYGMQIPEVTDVLDGGIGSKGDGEEWVWTQYGVLPAGSHDIELELASKDGEWASAPMTDGSIALVVEVRGVRNPDGMVRSITYVDASGERVTHRK